MADNMTGGDDRRTRSQLTLPDFELTLGRSPLKDAKTTLRHLRMQHGNLDAGRSLTRSSDTEPDSHPKAVNVGDEDTEDELLLSPQKSKDPVHEAVQRRRSPSSGSKRPSSSARQDEYAQTSDSCVYPPSCGRDLKRARMDLLPDVGDYSVKNKNSGRHGRTYSDPSVGHLDRRHAARTRSTTPSVTRESSLPTTTSGKKRAQSVPIFSPFQAESIPHLDLRRLPLLPQRARSRSPSKERGTVQVLHITSGPITSISLGALTDDQRMNVGDRLNDMPASQSAPNLPSLPTLSEEPDQLPTILNTNATEHSSGLQAVSGTLHPEDPVTTIEVPCASVLETQPHPSTPTLVSTPASPISPLTPLTETPFPPRFEGTQKSVTNDQTDETEPELSKSVAGASHPNLSKSRLPRPSSSSIQSTVPQPYNPVKQAQLVSMILPSHAPSSSKMNGASQVGTATSAAPRAPNAFEVLMAGSREGKLSGSYSTKGKNKATFSLPNIPAAASNASRIRNPGKAGGQHGQQAKPTVKSKMRPREKPKPVPTMMVPLVPLGEDPDESDENQLQESSPASPSNEPLLEQPGPVPDVAGSSNPSTSMPVVELSRAGSLSPLSSIENTDGKASTTPTVAQPAVKSLSTTDNLVNTENDAPPPVESKSNSSTAELAPEKNEAAISTKKSRLPRIAVSKDLPTRRVTRSVSQKSKTEEVDNKELTRKRSSLLPTPSNKPRTSMAQEAGTSGGAEGSDTDKQPGTPGSPMNIDSPVRKRRNSADNDRSLSFPKTPTAYRPREKLTTRSAHSSPSPSKLANASSAVSAHPSGVTGPSSLSNLANALEKLSMPPPARPSTSMGFHRDLDDSDVSNAKRTWDDIAVERNSGAAVTRIGLGRPSNGVKKASTLGAERMATLVSVPVSSKAANANAKGKVPRPMSMFLAQNRTSSFKDGSSTHSTGNAADRPRIFGLGTTAFGFGRGRVAPKASKKTTLPPVMHSPVKGGDNIASANDADNAETINASSLPANAASTNDVFIDATDSHDAEPLNRSSTKDAVGSWVKNASRRASLASKLLSESLTSTTQSDAPGSMGPPATPPSLRKGLRSSSRLAAMGTANASATSETGIVGEDAQSGAVSTEGLKVLEDCTVFLDVRTDDGDDASSLFTDMLRTMGAKILTRVGQTCTHIVYKNGVNSTVSRWRTLKSKPHVVGIAWVVECAEQRQHIDETKFLVGLEHVNVAGVVKRRRSMLPKLVSHAIGDTELPVLDRNKVMDEDGDVSMGELSTTATDDDNLTPLERIRLRMRK